jgi:hypothetical protein
MDQAYVAATRRHACRADIGPIVNCVLTGTAVVLLLATHQNFLHQRVVLGVYAVGFVMREHLVQGLRLCELTRCVKGV